MLNTITRDGATWIQTAPGAEHYSARWDNGHLFLHANRDCCHLKHPVVVSPKIVQTLWDKDVASGTTSDENDVQWCENCATKRVDG
jgi:hypothetical protein